MCDVTTFLGIRLVAKTTYYLHVSIRLYVLVYQLGSL
jgi:hypothetical protein